MRARIRAAATHLGVSGLIASALIAMVTLVWYPSPLFELAKGRDIFLLLIGCDITLGPVMTLIIFNIRKPRSELVRDVAIIATVQLGAMIYGVSTLLKVRPAYIVYNAGQFNVPLANELMGGLEAAAADGSSSRDTAPASPWFGPKLVGAKLPQEIDEHNRLLFSSVAGNGDVFQMPHYFVPYADVKGEVIGHAKSVDQVAKLVHAERGAIESATRTYAAKGADFGLLPLVIRTTTAIAVVDRKTGDLLGIEPIPREF